MKQRIIPLICLVAFCMAMLCPFFTHAATPLDPTQTASLKLCYQKDEQAFSNLQIEVYRVAEVYANGTFELIAPFASYPVNIHGITTQEQWNKTAETLTSYIVANQITPDKTGTTNEAGVVAFENLKTGLYLVSEVTAENDSGTFVFNKFMVYLPTPLEDGTFDYTIEANPKCINYVPKTEYKINKLWQDNGHQKDRPKEITVDIYKNGQLHDSKVLNAENNWSYTWYVSEDDKSNWTVTERTVSKKYTVTIQQSGGSFSIINTHTSIPSKPDVPQTGDSVSVLPYIIIMCISGIFLIILGLYGRRQREI